MFKQIHLTALTLVCSGFFYSAFSQISVGGQPLSFNPGYALSEDAVPGKVIASLDRNRLRDEDILNETDGKNPRFAKLIAANFNLQNSGLWTTLPNGDRVWRLKITAEEALATTLYYDDFFLPPGGKMFIWNEGRKQLIGGFTDFNNHESRTFATEVIYGPVCYIEYFEPASQTGQGRINISHTGYCYRYILNPEKDILDGACEVGINCSPEGTNWQDEKHGVVRMQVVDGGSAGWCSASVVNNTSLNCIPYVLSAYHCGVGSSTSDFNQYIFYFNYERSGCGTGSISSSQSMTGCAKKADSNDGGGNSGSDFMLLQLNNTIPGTYNPYYNGWNANNVGSTSGVSIHHPSGDQKRVSTYTQTLTTASYGVANTHWRVYWAATANGHGVTEGGSSGSPIFDNNGRIVGTLTGGSSYCSSPNDPDYYGKMSWHWTNNPNTAGQKLKAWLDPGNTGALTLNGTYAPCQPASPVANFYGTPTAGNPGTTVQFTDQSTNSPTSWAWNFGDPGSGGLNTSTSQNPSHTYNNVGLYTVTLTATNGSGSDSETKTNYINITTGGGTATCDTAWAPFENGSFVIYSSQSGGYVAGNNGYGDLAKAQKYSPVYSPAYINDIIVWFGAKKYTSGNPSSAVTFNIYSMNGPGITSGGNVNNAPGTILGSGSVAMSLIDTSGLMLITLPGTVTVTSAFAVGVDLSTLSAGDTVGIVSTTDGDAGGAELSWEKWSDGVWHTFLEPNGWGLDIDLGLIPIECDQLPVGIVTTVEANDFYVYPNPSDNILNVVADMNKQSTLTIIDISGQLIYRADIHNRLTTIDVSQYAGGIYFAQLSSSDKIKTLKFIITEK